MTIRLRKRKAILLVALAASICASAAAFGGDDFAALDLGAYFGRSTANGAGARSAQVHRADSTARMDAATPDAHSAARQDPAPEVVDQDRWMLVLAGLGMVATVIGRHMKRD